MSDSTGDAPTIEPRELAPDEVIPEDALDETPSAPPPAPPAQPAAQAAPEATMDDKLTGSPSAPETKDDSKPVDPPAPEQHDEVACDQGPVTVVVVHGSYHGPGCPDPDKRKWPNDKGFDYDAHHPAYVDEVIEGLSREEADRLIRDGICKEVKPGSK